MKRQSQLGVLVSIATTPTGADRNVVDVTLMEVEVVNCSPPGPTSALQLRRRQFLTGKSGAVRLLTGSRRSTNTNQNMNRVNT